MNYLVVSFPDPLKLSNEVNTLIEKGWRPHGGVSVSTHTYEKEYREPGLLPEKRQHIGIHFAQAMIHD